jgi:hypothetical protein
VPGHPVCEHRGDEVLAAGEAAVERPAAYAGALGDVVQRGVEAVLGEVTLVYYGPGSPGPLYLAVRGRARVDPSANDAVYAAMIEGERGQDPERKGVAVLIDVEHIAGFAADGPFEQAAA